jgi:hypothetical protein|tara:strand:+ start:816 stop:1094 length:279 start_codon:yes stop_codon:yes gene_type:complete
MKIVFQSEIELSEEQFEIFKRAAKIETDREWQDYAHDLVFNSGFDDIRAAIVNQEDYELWIKEISEEDGQKVREDAEAGVVVLHSRKYFKET